MSDAAVIEILLVFMIILMGCGLIRIINATDRIEALLKELQHD